MLIAIPSKGRAGKAKSAVRLPGAILYVPKQEEKAYRKFGHENVVPVPMKVKGITATRNWILDNTSENWIVMLDDDVERAGWIELQPQRAIHHEIKDEEIWRGEFAKLFEITEDIGYRIWGLDTYGAPRGVYPYRPFIFHTYVTASCMGILNSSGLRFDESFPVKEDYELCLRCLKEDGGVVGARYFFWRNKHWHDEGGCKDYRTQDMERDCIMRLIKMYPGFVRSVKRAKGTGEYSIQLDF